MTSMDSGSTFNGNNNSNNSNGSKILLDLQDTDSIDDSWNYQFDESSLNVLRKGDSRDRDNASFDSKDLPLAHNENSSSASELNEKISRSGTDATNSINDLLAKHSNSNNTRFPDPFQDRLSSTLSNDVDRSEESSQLDEANETLDSMRVNSPTPIKLNSLHGGTTNPSELKLSSSLSSSNSNSLTPIGIKSNPADPETTKRDILSTSFTPSDSMNELLINGANGNGSNLSVSTKPISGLDTKSVDSLDSPGTAEATPTTPSNSFFSTFRSISSVASSLAGSGSTNGSVGSLDSTPTLAGKQQQQQQHRRSISDISLDTPVTPTNHHTRYNSSGSAIPEEEGKVEEVIGSDGTPNIISYRRTRRSRNNTNSSTPGNPKSPEINPIGSQDENKIPIPMSPTVFDYDKNLYVDEKYLDTQYRYATLKRNVDYHELFKTIPSDDRLLDDFSCALSREILLQGRLYVSEHYLCFNSNILGWVTNLVISLDDISGFEKRVTAGLFPNGIVIETKDAKHSFASLVSRDPTLNFIETIWSKSISLSESNGEPKRDVHVLSGTLDNFTTSMGTRQLLTEKDIFTIDEDAPEDHSVRHVSTSPAKALSEFEYHNDGPEGHDATEIDFDCDSNGETLLFKEVFPVPVGLLFDIFFGENTKFHKNIMALNEGSDFSDYSKFTEVDRDDAIFERSFEYERALGYSVGPKSTRVECTEKIEKKDYNEKIQILTISKTPNVPSGGSFSVNTRYIFAWAENNNTTFQLSYKVNWTGRSFLKGVIERNTLSGQQSVAETIKSELKKLLDTYSPYASESAVGGGLEKAPVFTSETDASGKEKLEAQRQKATESSSNHQQQGSNESTITKSLAYLNRELKEFIFSSDSRLFFAMVILFIQLYSIWQLRASNKLLLNVAQDKDESLKLVLFELHQIKEKLSIDSIKALNNE